MTPEERLDRWYSLLRPRLLELAEEGHEVRFDAEKLGFFGAGGWRNGFRFSLYVRRGEFEEYGRAEPEEALEGFLE